MEDPEQLTSFKKSEIAAYAVNIVREKMKDLGDNISPTEAATLGALYTVYQMESALHHQDDAWKEFESGAIGYDEIAEDWRVDRMQAEQAIMEAEKGNYSGIKDYLVRKGKWFQELLSNREIGKDLEKVATKIPDTEVPFKVPQPAWKDPQFLNAQDDD